jgi:glycogen debranching enzyme
MLLSDADDRFHIQAPSSMSLSAMRVLKHGETFAVFDRNGNIRPREPIGAEGLYHEGTRFLSTLDLLLCGERPLSLGSTVREDNLVLTADLMNPDLGRDGRPVIPHGTLHLARSKLLWQGACYERVQISNYGMCPVDIELSIEFAADFADVFEVRGTKRARRGELHPAVVSPAGALLSYTGLDGVWRGARLLFTPSPDRCSSSSAAFALHLEAKQTKDIYLTVACETGVNAESPRPPFERAFTESAAKLAATAGQDCRVDTSSGTVNSWLHRSVADLRMMITQTASGPYPYAGVPWFSTPFGRDGILTAFSSLWVMPELARGVLLFLAETQAMTSDPSTDAQPGKILHEMRQGEMAAQREIPFGRYYGSIDSTPLYVMLAAAYHERTADTAFIERIWPHIELALEWIDKYGDLDGDGFVEYARQAPEGLIHQGWKDSHDAIFHADGTLAQAPIALCEVQGYVYAARCGAAALAAALGHEQRAHALRKAAEALRARFDAAFWCQDLGMYALALDGAKRPCRVRSSNAGQCLFGGIALPTRAGVLADQLLSEEMFSGWGIRTLATGAVRYNPVSYHNGSVWPHDNALIAWGLSTYGFHEHALRVFSALYDVSRFVDLHRLPELFCGFARRPGDGPTLYPVACAPQAWSAAAALLLLRAALGMSIQAEAARVRFESPALPAFLDHVLIKQLRVGRSTVDLALRRHPEDVGIRVTGRTGRIEILAVK